MEGSSWTDLTSFFLKLGLTKNTDGPKGFRHLSEVWSSKEYLSLIRIHNGDLGKSKNFNIGYLTF